jgi:ABC-type amino acid transport/signal transduction systems, periplasmic component/domain
MVTTPTLRRITAILCAVGALSLPGCQPDEPETTGCTPKLGKSNINIGVKSDQPGWGFEENYSRSGFDYDLANWLADQLCFTATFVNVSSAQREDYLISGRVDLVIATFSKTDERASRVSFAAPYVVNRQGVLVRAGDDRIQRLSDLNGMAVCTASGTTSLVQLEAAESVEITAVALTGFRECMDELLAGRVDAISTDQLILYGMAQHDPRLAVVPDLVFGHQERYGIGIPYGQIEWCEKLTAEIRKFIIGSTWDTYFRLHLPNVEQPARYRPDPNLLDRCS